MYLPFADIHFDPVILITIGFCVGVLGGFFGVGGSWMVTPALNMFGFPMAFAIGTDLAHIMGKSIIATFKHRQLGNVDLKLGLLMIIGTAAGVEAGKELILHLERTGHVEPVVRVIYIVILGSIGSYMVYDYFAFTRETRRRLPGLAVAERIGSALSRKLHDWHAPPMVSLQTSRIRAISFWAILVVGFATGLFAGFLGGGAGYIRLPALVYAIGVPTTIAVGTDLFEIIFSAGIGAFLYALEGKVDLTAAMTMMVGAAVGAQIGTIATRYVKSMRIRLYFGYTVLLAGLSVLLKQWAVHTEAPQLGLAAGYLIVGLALFMSLLIMLSLAKGVREEKR
ncbi:MAG: sulfite exporter TauE/SafE family protein [Nitrospirota bacterium]